MTASKSLPTLASLLRDPQAPYIHRDISWLQFNGRVLDEACDMQNPVLERAKFLAISASNLDEFFTIRYASLIRNINSLERKGEVHLLKALKKTHAHILEEVARLEIRQATILQDLTGELRTFGVQVGRSNDPDSPRFRQARQVFHDQILPLLSPPEPYSSRNLTNLGNLGLAAFFMGQSWFTIPKGIPSAYLFKAEGSDERSIFFLDELLADHLGAAFSMTTSGPPTLVRLTRDGDFTVDLEEEDTESIPDVVRTGIGTRDKGRPVRLQSAGPLPPGFAEKALTALKLEPGDLHVVNRTLGLHGLLSATKQIPERDSSDGKRYFFPPIRPAMRRLFREAGDSHSIEAVFEFIKKRDHLLHHPYDSFDTFIRFIQISCEDPRVTQIEMTIYRTDAVSPILDALMAAAASKRVRVMIELRARFDELNNLRLAESLRKAGVEVAFGFGKLKLHAKLALITRNEEKGQKLYTHLSTGNYHSVTARQYTDLAIITANEEIGADVRHFFDRVWNGQVPSTFKQLVSAPSKLQRRIQHLIEAETQAAYRGQPARIFAKVNALVDETVIETLYRASQAGVKVDLIVRGACSLIPGVKGLSENIRVISIVDRFLEHSRIYYFGSSGVMYLSSADWMPRNFFSRLEIAYPVLDPVIRRYLEETVIPAYLSDRVKARELTPRGVWQKRRPPKEGPPVRSQTFFQELAENDYQGTAFHNPASSYPGEARPPAQSPEPGSGQRPESKGPQTKP